MKDDKLLQLGLEMVDAMHAENEKALKSYEELRKKAEAFLEQLDQFES
ncbi:MAG: hypothetical protein R3B71_05215 [Candidatus Gracilibacteria bacterium]|nr:hypothetical protein [Candidatus Peregrinibacteria bacterium]